MANSSILANAPLQDLDIVIFWGSQGGRAEVLAKRLAGSLEDRFGLRALVADLDDYDHFHLVELQPSYLCGFVLSTYGDGDPADNTAGFWNVVSAMHRNQKVLSNMRYIMFGLGNSKYRQYNKVAEYVDSVFQDRGAIRFGDAGRGDDAEGLTEDDFLTWRGSIERELKFRLHLTVQSRTCQPAFDVQVVTGLPADCVYVGEPHSSTLSQSSSGRLAIDVGVPSVISLASAEKLWESSSRVCVHLSFDLGADRSAKYKTGDHFAIWPSNPNHEVNKLLGVLNLENSRNAVISIASKNGRTKSSIPTPTSVEALFRYYLEISGLIPRETISALLPFAPSKSAVAELERIGGNFSVFTKVVRARKLTLADLLTHVSRGETWVIPYSFLIERLKRTQPRYYSICSPASVQPMTLSIVAVVEKPLEPIYQGCSGLATNYLRELEQSVNGKCCSPALFNFALCGPRNALSGGKVYGRVRQSNFKLPHMASTPIIMIGCGTGVAPFRAFVQERVRSQQIGHDVGKTLLFMGFRHPDRDVIYGDDWKSAQDALGTDQLKIYTAFSRNVPSRPVYVQDRLRDNAAEVLELSESHFGTRIYICGSANMARDVATALVEIRRTVKGDSLEQANAWVRYMRQQKLLVEDVWNS